MNKIHDTTVVEKGAQLGNNITIGPFCVIGKDVVLHDSIILHSHISIKQKVIIKENTEIFPFVSFHRTQYEKEKDAISSISIGKNNVIREYCNINTGSSKESITKVGDNCLLMIGCHIAHNCNIGNHVEMANHSTLGGYVEIGDRVVLGGLSAYHQKIKVGDYSMIGGGAIVDKDVAPYSLVKGERARLAGANIVGLKRNNFDKAEIKAIVETFKLLRLSPKESFHDKIEKIISLYGENIKIKELVNFIKKERNSSILLYN